MVQLSQYVVFSLLELERLSVKSHLFHGKADPVIILFFDESDDTVLPFTEFLADVIVFRYVVCGQDAV